MQTGIFKKNQPLAGIYSHEFAIKMILFGCAESAGLCCCQLLNLRQCARPNFKKAVTLLVLKPGVPSRVSQCRVGDGGCQAVLLDAHG